MGQINLVSRLALSRNGAQALLKFRMGCHTLPKDVGCQAKIAKTRGSQSLSQHIAMVDESAYSGLFNMQNIRP